MSKRSKRKGHVTTRRDGTTYRQDRAPIEPTADQLTALLARVRDDIDREKRIQTLTRPA